MSGLQLLGAYLTEVVAEILRVVEEAVAEHREEAARARRENHSLRSQLRDVLLLEARAEWPRAGSFLDPLSLSDPSTLTPPIFSFVPAPQVALVQPEQQRVSCSRSEESKPTDVPNSQRKRTRDGPRARAFPPNGVRVKEEPEERRVNEGGERGRGGGPEERGVREEERWSRREENERRASEGEEEERRSKRGEEETWSKREEEERRSRRTGKDTTRVEERVRKKESERGGEERESERREEDTKAEEERGEGDMTERSEEGEERGTEGGEDGGLVGLEELETWIKTEPEQTSASRTEGGAAAAAPPVDQASPWRLASPPPPRSPPRSAARCPRCGDTFPSGSALLLHLQQLKKPHCCDFCCKSFSQSADLRRHLRTHTGERPHRCGYCARAFSQRGNLRRHLRVHTGERPYACHTCSRRFSDGDTLKKHQRTHT